MAPSWLLKASVQAGMEVPGECPSRHGGPSIDSVPRSTEGACLQHCECPPWPGLGWEVEKRLTEEKATEGGHDEPLKVSGNEQVTKGSVGVQTPEHLSRQVSRLSISKLKQEVSHRIGKALSFPRASLPQ